MDINDLFNTATNLTMGFVLGSFYNSGKQILHSKYLEYKENMRYEESYKKALGLDFGNHEYSIFTNKHHMHFKNGEPIPNSIHIQNILASSSFIKAKKDSDFKLREYNDIFKVPVNTNAYIIGSPTSELMAQYMFSYEPETSDENKKQNYQKFTGLIEYPIRWVLNRENTKLSESSHFFQISKDNPKKLPFRELNVNDPKLPNWGIELDKNIKAKLIGGNRSPYIYPEEENFSIQGKEIKLFHRDYLLITRIPNIFSKEAVDYNQTVVSIAGTHGVGLLSFEKLLNTPSVLREIGKALSEKGISDKIKKKHHFGFQILLEVEVDYDKKTGRQRFTSIHRFNDMEPISFGENLNWSNIAEDLKKKHLIQLSNY